MKDFEKLGVFYLGKKFDPKTKQPTDDLVLYDSKDLVTHALCVGMTGSGKTGLCLALIEEAAIDGIPAILIDPKGDLANLLLTFPALRPEDFRPWINEDDARRKNLSADDYARQQAEQGSRLGARTAPASSACATRPTSRSTPRAATRASRSRSSSRSRRRRPPSARTRSCCGSASAPPPRACWGSSASTPIRSRAASTS
jgi:DNA helicase HerA-like ATPase